MDNHSPPQLVASHGSPRRTQPCSYLENLEQRVTWTSVQNNSARPNLAQFAAPALPTTCKIAEPIIQGLPARKPETPQRRISLFFLIVHSKTESCLGRPQNATVSLLKPLAFPIEFSNIALKAKQKYKLRISYRTTASFMHTANCLLDSRAGVNLIRSSMVPNDWTHHIKLDNLSTLRTFTKEPHQLDRLILLHLRLGALWTHIWFCISPHLAVDILRDNSFVNRFIHGIFPLKRKFVPWPS